MTMAVAALGSLVGVDTAWSDNWAWGLPLIVLTVLMHVLCLGLFYRGAFRPYHRKSAHPVVVLIVAMGTTTLLATCLHARPQFGLSPIGASTPYPTTGPLFCIRSVRSQATATPIWFRSHTGSRWERSKP